MDQVSSGPRWYCTFLPNFARNRWQKYMPKSCWLVVEPTSLKNMSSSIGMMNFPTEWKNKSHVPVTTNQSCYSRNNGIRQDIRVTLHQTNISGLICTLLEDNSTPPHRGPVSEVDAMPAAGPLVTAATMSWTRWAVENATQRQTWWKIMG